VADVRRRLGHPQQRQGAQAFFEKAGVAAADAQPFRQALQLTAPDRGLDLGHPPVGA
jgi:hypothetical protein